MEAIRIWGKMKRSTLSIVFALISFSLAGCATKNTAPPPCPAVLKVGDASRLTKFAGPSEDLTDAAFEAKIDGMTSKCFYGEGGIRTELKIQFSASRAPRFSGDSAKFQYFIAVTGPNQKPLAREVFDAEIDMSGQKVRNIAVDEIEPLIPLKQGENGDYFRIYVGFILDEKELAYNRRNPQ